MTPEPATTRWEPLFRPFRLGGLHIPNRIVMAPMTRQFSPNHAPDENVAAYYRRRAEGGVGLIVTEGVGIDQPSAIGDGSARADAVPVLHGHDALAGWRRVVGDVHAAGGLIFPQLWHQGPFRVVSAGDTAPPLRPSGLWGPAGRYSTVPQEYIDRVIAPTPPMTEQQIGDTIEAFARSATNARSIGFDGIAVHGASGYLIDSFLWHETNRRRDRYGGSPRARARFAVEVVAAIRAAVGPDLPILFRFGQWKQQDFHAMIARDATELATMLEPLAEAGVDIFDASTLYYSAPAFAGSDLSLAAWAKRVTGRPVIAGGGIGLPTTLFSTRETAGADVEANIEDAADRVDRGEFDMIYLGRSLIADAAWPSKVAAGRPRIPFDRSQLASLE